MNDMKPMLLHKFIDTHLKSINGLLKQTNQKLNEVNQKQQEQNVLKPANSQDQEVIKGDHTTGIEAETSSRKVSYNDFLQKQSTPKNEESSEEAPHDLNLFENWRKKSCIQTKKQPQYLHPHPEITQKDSILKMTKKRLLLNGNMCNAIKQNQNLFYMIRNT